MSNKWIVVVLLMIGHSPVFAAPHSYGRPFAPPTLAPASTARVVVAPTLVLATGGPSNLNEPILAQANIKSDIGWITFTSRTGLTSVFTPTLKVPQNVSLFSTDSDKEAWEAYERQFSRPTGVPPSTNSNDLSIQRLGTASDSMSPGAVSEEPIVSSQTSFLATNQGPLDTFVLPEPVRKAGWTPSHTQSSSGRWQGSQTHAIVQDQLAGEVTYSAFPGLDPIDVNVGGQMDGRLVQTHLEPTKLFSNGILNSNSLFLSSGGSGMDIGGGNSNVPDAGSGLRLFRSIDHHSDVAGVGLYERIGTSGLSLIPGVDTEIESSKTHSTDFAVAADSSLRLTNTNLVKGWSTLNFVGWSESSHTAETALSLFRQFNNTSLSQSIGLSSGSEHGFAWRQGLSQRLGAATILLNDSISRAVDSSGHLTTVSLLRPVGRDIVSLRWQTDDETSGSTALKASQLVGNFILPTNQGSTVIITESRTMESGAVSQEQTDVSDNWEIDRLFDIDLGISYGWKPRSERINGGIGLWATPQWQAKFLFAPSVFPTQGQSTPMVFGFQIVNKFHLLTLESGIVRGSVLVDGLPSTQPIKVRLDDTTVNTDKKGNFVFNRVLIGFHDVGFDLANLPASLSPLTPDQTVQVLKGKTTPLVLSAQRVGVVRGKVIVEADAFGQVDPTAGMGLVVSDGQGHDTTTGADDAFALGSLPYGPHTISVAPSSLPPGYVVEGDQQFDVVITSDSTPQDLVFRISPHQTINMTTLSK